MSADWLDVVRLKRGGVFPVRLVVDLLIADPTTGIDLSASLAELILEYAPGSASQLGLIGIATRCCDLLDGLGYALGAASGTTSSSAWAAAVSELRSICSATPAASS